MSGGWRTVWHNLWLGVALAVAVPVAGPMAAQVSGCAVCHAKPDAKRVLPSGRVQSLFIDRDDLQHSVHRDKACVDCHTDVIEIPHTRTPETVNCMRCHFEGNTAGAPQGRIYAEFEASVHGRALAAGDERAPACQDCHGDHSIEPHAAATSPVARENIAAGCAACHLEIYTKFRTSVHGAALDSGNVDVPTCTDCHSEHGIRKHDDPRSPTYAGNVAATCAACHSAEGIVGKYGISIGQVAAYKESFHGVASSFGMRTVANCASCHGVHDIRSHNDPASRVHVDNIPTTCGECHDGANANYAIGTIHVQPQDRSSGIVYWVSAFFKWLTISTICVLVAHISLDLSRQLRDRRRARSVIPRPKDSTHDR